MKIKITESQAMRLGFMKEEEAQNPLTKFIALCNKLAIEVNKLYGKILVLSVDEIIHDNNLIPKLKKELSSIEGLVDKAYDECSAYIETLPEDNFDMQMYNARDKVSPKIDTLALMLSDLEDVSDRYTSNDSADVFKDFRRIEVGTQTF